MVKKKRELLETTTTVIMNDNSLSQEEKDQEYASLRASLEEIRTSKGVIGYIIRNETWATADLNDATNLVNYALLSSEIFDSFHELSGLFNLGQSESMLVQGKNAKVLCILMDENKISVFMEKDADDLNILKRIMSHSITVNPLIIK